MTPWVFGVEPLDQTERAASALRRVTDLVLAAEAEDADVERLIADLQRAASVLAERVRDTATPRIGGAVDRDARVYLDHGRDLGAFNPAFPEYDLAVDGDHASGTVSFPILYEGPPGVVHGGFLALFVDCVVQHHNCEVGTAGQTTSLSLRYHRPALLLRPLSFSVDRATSDGRIRSTCRLLDGDRLLCEADVDAIAGDRAALPAVSPRRS